MYRHYYIWERGSSLIPALETGLEPCRRLVHMLWPSSGQKWEATVSTCLSFIAICCIICCHRKLCGSLPPEAAGHLCFPTLRGGLSSRMWIAFFSNSSLGVLAWSTTVVSSHLIGWWLSHACFASADFSSAPSDRHPDPVWKLVSENYPFLQASWEALTSLLYILVLYQDIEINVILNYILVTCFPLPQQCRLSPRGPSDATRTSYTVPRLRLVMVYEVVLEPDTERVV